MPALPDDHGTAREYDPSPHKHCRPLLVLDLDGTLLDTCKKGTREGPPTFMASDFPDEVYETRIRPGLAEFLTTVTQKYDLAVFTAGSSEYAEAMIAGIETHAFTGFRTFLRCTFSREQTKVLIEPGQASIIKDLRDVAQHCRVPLERCLIVDDSPSTYQLNCSNALPVPTYLGTVHDDALAELAEDLMDMTKPNTPLDVTGYRLAPPRAVPLLAAVPSGMNPDG